MVVYLYGDDPLVTGRDMDEIEKFKNELEDHVDMSSLGEVNHFPSVEVM